MVSLEVVVKHLNAHHALLDYSPAHWLQAMVTKMTKKNSPHENSRPAYIMSAPGLHTLWTLRNQDTMCSPDYGVSTIRDENNF